MANAPENDTLRDDIPQAAPEAPPAAVDAELQAQVSQQQAAELQQLVSEQVMSANPEKPMTMTEVLADPQGALAQKAQALGATAEWEQFTQAQQGIGQMREELLKVEEERSAAVQKIADVGAAQEQDVAKIRKNSGIAGIAGAVLGGAGAAWAAAKKTQSNPVRAVVAAAGALLGAAVAAVFSAKRGVKKTMENVQEQMANLGEGGNEEALAQKSAELQEQLGMAQQQSMETLIDALVTRMTGQELAAQQAAQAKATPEAPAAEQAAPDASADASIDATTAGDRTAHTTEPASVEPAQRVAQLQEAMDLQSKEQPSVSMVEQAAPAASKAEAVLRERAQQQDNGMQR